MFNENAVYINNNNYKKYNRKHNKNNPIDNIKNII